MHAEPSAAVAWSSMSGGSSANEVLRRRGMVLACLGGVGAVRVRRVSARSRAHLLCKCSTCWAKAGSSLSCLVKFSIRSFCSSKCAVKRVGTR